MSQNFWFNYFIALLVVALLLAGLYGIVRTLARGRVLVSADRRLVTVLESTVLSQHAAVHAIKVGSQYLLVGATNGSLATLSELSPEEVEAWLAEQRASLGATRASLAGAMKFLRKRS